MTSFRYVPYVPYVSSVTFLTLRALLWLETPLKEQTSLPLICCVFAEIAVRRAVQQALPTNPQQIGSLQHILLYVNKNRKFVTSQDVVQLVLRLDVQQMRNKSKYWSMGFNP